MHIISTIQRSLGENEQAEQVQRPAIDEYDGKHILRYIAFLDYMKHEKIGGFRRLTLQES